MPQTPGTILEPPAAPAAPPPSPPPAAQPAPPVPPDAGDRQRGAQPHAALRRGGLRLHRAAALVVAVLVLATAASTVLALRTVNDQEQRQLDLRAEEAAAVISSSLGSLDATLSGLIAAADVAPAHHSVFDTLAQPLVTPRGGAPAAYRQVVAVHRTGPALVVTAATDAALVGKAPPAGEASTALAAALASAGLLQTTPVFGDGGARSIGFAKSLDDTAVYVVSPVAAYTPPSSEGPFSDLAGALYATGTQQPDQAVLATTRSLPVTGQMGSTTIPVGRAHWLLVAQARSPLVGSVALALPWVVLGAGVLTVVLTALVVEGVARRRDYALALVDRRTVELRRRATELERSNADLQRFAYVASHDLSEPLRTVSGFANLLSTRYKGHLDADADEFIDYIDEGISRMQSLIEGLLSYSRLGTRAQPFSPVQTRDLVSEVLAQLQRLVEEKGAVVEVGSLPDVVADRTQLAQVFQNLLRNALTFVAPGVAPHVVVGATADQAQRTWTFAVADNGIGIEPAYRQRVFEMFQRLQARDAYPGTGMGLAICKRVVERHGGRIWVEDNPGGGSVVRCTIPFVPLEQPEGDEEA